MMEQNLNTETIEMVNEVVETTPEVIEQAAGMGLGTKVAIAGLVVAGAAAIYVGVKKYKEHKAKKAHTGDAANEPIDTTCEDVTEDEE